MQITVEKQNMVDSDQEFVERKGIGHPDTLADGLAEYLSINYSNYTKNLYGAVLHHNFDKVGLLGGASSVSFGEGKLTKPIRVLINGRASTRFGDNIIPVKDLLLNWTKEFMKLRFPILNEDIDLEFHYNLSNQSSPGKTNEKYSEKGTRKYWFEPRDLNDLQEIKRLFSNDTSLGVGYSPYSKLENFILNVENTLNSKKFHEENPWIGSDIKLMGYRNKENFYLTMCIPQIANRVKTVQNYKENLEFARNKIMEISKGLNILNLELNINTRDNYETSELYLTAIGSSIESGDEGLVGRGNRINGVISPFKPMSMEGACGKNPVYHIGKIYYLAAHIISQKIFENFNIKNEVFLVSQSGRDLLDPWKIVVNVPKDFSRDKELESLVVKEIKNIPQITNAILNWEYTIY